MRAIVITRPGGPEVLEVQERPAPEPGLGQIRVRVHASALNRADLMQREGNYPAPPGVVADIPGLEYAGEVDAMGAGVTLWRVGDRVMGIVAGAAHAEYLCTHEREAMPIPSTLSWEDAAAIPEVFLTAYDALFTRLGVQVGERVLVHAAGSGVGTAAVQLAHVAGATTFGTSRSAAKLARTQALGLDHAIDASMGDWAGIVEQLAGASGIHAVVDLVGGAYLRGNLRVLASRGRLVFVGHMAGNRAELDLGIVLGKRLRLVGTVLRTRPIEEKIALARAFSSRIVPMFDAGRVRPVIDRVLSFDDVRAAHELLSSDVTFGKVVLRWA
jgi:putative PIG3 family NAD(P)H quinone oxidoreductase